MPEAANVPSINTNKVPNKRFLLAAIVSAVLLALTVGLVVYFYSRGLPKFYQSNKSLGQITPTPKPTATPIPLRPDNGTSGTYAVSQGKHVGPTFKQIIFDPLDVQKGQPMTITVLIYSESPISEVTGDFQMDNSSLLGMSFQKVSRDEVKDIETWKTDIVLGDSVLYKYILNLSAKAVNGVSTMVIAPRS